MSTTRLYCIAEAETGRIRLVDATSPAQAIRHCTKGRFHVSTPSAKDVAKLMNDGVKVETVSKADADTP
jgi:hypothetical protein